MSSNRSNPEQLQTKLNSKQAELNELYANKAKNHNSFIYQVNQLINFVDNDDAKISKLQEEIATLKKEISDNKDTITTIGDAVNTVIKDAKQSLKKLFTPDEKAAQAQRNKTADEIRKKYNLTKPS